MLAIACYQVATRLILSPIDQMSGMKNVFYVITIIMSTLDTSHGISRISVHVNVIVGYISTQFKNL